MTNQATFAELIAEAIADQRAKDLAARRTLNRLARDARDASK